MKHPLSLRILYLRTGTRFDLTAACTAADDLVATASPDQLHMVAAEWFHDHPRHHHGPAHDLAADRERVTTLLHQYLTAIAISLAGPHVDRHPMGTPERGITAYITGGTHVGDDPTDTYTTWGILFLPDRLPTGWTTRLGAAAGLLKPGPGTDDTTITFTPGREHRWAAAGLPRATVRLRPRGRDRLTGPSPEHRTNHRPECEGAVPMGADMLARTVYLLAGTPFDLAAAQATATRLVRDASAADLEHLRTWNWTDANEPDPHQAATTALHQALQVMADSLHGREVDSYRIDRGDDPGVDVYITGGLSHGDGPTDAYDEWSVLIEEDTLPAGWAAGMAAGAGLIHPHGTGAIIACVAFRAWT